MSRIRREPGEHAGSRRALVLLGAGLAAGVALAAAGVVKESTASVPSGAVAVVNGRPIARPSYERLLAGLAEDKRGPLTDEDRSHVLDRLIDEELLIQRALELDLVRNEPRVRGELADAVIAAAVAQADVGAPSPAELERFFADNRDAFRGAARVRLRRVFVAAEPVRPPLEAEQLARAAADRLRAGETFESVRADLGDPPAAELPEALLTPPEVRRYAGPTAARTAFELSESQVSEPLRFASGFQVLKVVERQAPTGAGLEEVDSAVRAEWKRRAEERALRGYLDELRAAASVVMSPSR